MANKFNATEMKTKTGEIELIGRVTMPNCQITGSRYSIMNRALSPGEEVQCDPGVMMYKSPDIKMNVAFGGFGRLFSGEGLAKVTFKNNTQEMGFVGLTPNFPFGVVMPVVPGELPDKELYCKRGAFMAGDEGIRVGMKILPAASCLACCCGGMPPLIQSVKSKKNSGDVAFLNAGGTIVKKTLKPNEIMLVDTDAVVGFSPSVTYDVRKVGSCLSCCCGGEGCFNTKLVGPGDIYLQTVSYEKLAKLLVSDQSGGGGKKGGGGDDPAGALIGGLLGGGPEASHDEAALEAEEMER